MEGAFLTTTSTEGLEPLGELHQRSYELVVGTIQDRDGLTDRHAVLFAEPRGSDYGDRIDWYAAADGRARAFDTLDEEERAAAEAVLHGLIADIRKVADGLLASKESNVQSIGEALANAVRYPGSGSIFVIGKGQELQPVIVNWAWVADTKAAVVGTLSGSGGQSAAATAAAAASATPVAASAAPVPPTPAARGNVARGGLWWLLWLGWLLLMLMIGAILYLMIEACALRVPGFPNYCPPPGPVASNFERDALVLRDRIAAVEQRIGVADRACQPRRAAAIVPVVPDADTLRLAERGAREGRLTLSLLWELRADLHMDVVCPGGQTINYDNRSACGGQLDVGGNHSASTAVPDAVESMYFDAPAPGTYSVSIHVYNPQGAAPQQPFRLRIKDGDKVDVRTGTVVHGQGNWTTQFTLGGN